MTGPDKPITFVAMVDAAKREKIAEFEHYRNLSDKTELTFAKETLRAIAAWLEYKRWLWEIKGPGFPSEPGEAIEYEAMLGAYNFYLEKTGGK